VRRLIDKYPCYEPCPNCGKTNWQLVAKLEYNPDERVYDIHLLQCLDCMLMVNEGFEK
jgi:predicted  nucleic acid-binding Zn ribbon protein